MVKLACPNGGEKFILGTIFIVVALLYMIVYVYLPRRFPDSEDTLHASRIFNTTESITASRIPSTTSRALTSEIGCYRIKQASLPDLIKASPRKDKSIFFLETSCKSYYSNKIHVTPRQACAVESAALTNPSFDVHLSFASPGLIRDEGTGSDRTLQALLTYKNIKVHHVDYEEFVKGTPGETLYREGLIEKSSFVQNQASNLLRLVTLWRYGGIYLDLDTITLKPLEELGQNYAGSESETHVNSAVLNFSAAGKGHDFAELCLNELKKNFRGDTWGYNGPKLITRMLQKNCGVEMAKDMLNNTCEGFKVYPQDTFYAVPWREWKMYFDSNATEALLSLTKNSYVLHTWNHFSADIRINVTDDVPYAMFAEIYCPKVFAECDEYF